MSDTLEKLERLQKLRMEGALSEAEFTAEKAKLLGGARDATPAPASIQTPREPSNKNLAIPTASTPSWWIWLAGGIILIGMVTAFVLMRTTPTTPIGSPEPSPKPSSAAAPVDPLADLSPAERLSLAEAAAWPSGRRSTTANGSRINYQNGLLVEAPFGAVLVSEGRVPDATHVDSGYVAVAYLAAQGRAAIA